MVKSKREPSPKKRGPLTMTNRPTTRAVATTTRGMSAANIKVVVRIRPENAREQGDNFRNIIRIVDDQMLVFDPKEDSQPFFYQGVQQKNRDLLKRPNKDLKFMFDKVFRPDLPNYDVFRNSTFSLIDSLMDGYNCSVFAYGATGAGKTFTMIGNEECPGITYLTMAELFKRKEELSSERDFELGITYLEVYNENVRDLLNPGPALHLREDNRYGVMVAGIKMHRIESPDELFELLEKGNRCRTQHPTDANAESSRSHAVFQVYLQMTEKCTGQVQTAKLSMIDLAGSERASATGCVGARFAEGANINKSLLALGNCINSLADGHRHIPYRDSKLTRLLKDSLGGNCQTVMIANVSPSSLTFEDTYNTLKYATRAKKIKSAAKRNVVNVEMHVGQYVKITEELKEEIRVLKKKLADTEAAGVVIEIPTLVAEKAELLALFQQKKGILERQYHIQTLDMGMALRKKFKEDVNARVSDYCEDTPEKVEAHKKLDDIVSRFQNKGDALKEELVRVQRERLDCDCEIGGLLERHPGLKGVGELEHLKMSEYESGLKYTVLEKHDKIMADKAHDLQEIVDKMSGMLPTMFYRVKNSGLATESFIRDYQSLGRYLKDVKGIKFGDSGVGSSSATSLETVEDAAGVENSDALSETFSMGGGKPEQPVAVQPPAAHIKRTRAANMMARVYESPAAKELARRIAKKETGGRVARRPLTGVRTDSAKIVKPRHASTRPPFR